MARIAEAASAEVINVVRTIVSSSISLLTTQVPFRKPATGFWTRVDDGVTIVCRKKLRGFAALAEM